MLFIYESTKNVLKGPQYYKKVTLLKWKLSIFKSVIVGKNFFFLRVPNQLIMPFNNYLLVLISPAGIAALVLFTWLHREVNKK
jgi:hypothetical protein